MSTGYGPRYGRLKFDGDETKYELWEVKFLGHMRLQKLHETILPQNEGGLADGDIDVSKDDTLCYVHNGKNI